MAHEIAVSKYLNSQVSSQFRENHGTWNSSVKISEFTSFFWIHKFLLNSEKTMVHEIAVSKYLNLQYSEETCEFRYFDTAISCAMVFSEFTSFFWALCVVLSTRRYSGGKRRPTSNADNPTGNYEQTVTRQYRTIHISQPLLGVTQRNMI
jgi:hypothetical protein